MICAFFIDEFNIDFAEFFKDCNFFKTPEILQPSQLTLKTFYKRFILKSEEDVI